MHTHTHSHTETHFPTVKKICSLFFSLFLSLFHLRFSCAPLYFHHLKCVCFNLWESNDCLTNNRGMRVRVFVRKREDGEEGARRKAGFLFGLQMGDIKLSLERMRCRREKACVQVVLGMRLWASGVRDKNHGSALTGAQRPTNKHASMEQHLDTIWIHKLFKISTHRRNEYSTLYYTSSSHYRKLL